ncbi:MAG: endonuclease/exonuclease/phosphatase family protein [Myxococcales bacterium]|nr:endonuclease/exonuclease/phosphatase family protein [Myxococcales bacterium]
MTTWTATLWTYNIRVGVESSLDALAAAVRAHGAPDLIALQEVGVRWQMGERVDQPATLAAAVGLDYHAFAGALLDGNGGRFGVALLSRWPLDGVQTTNLPRAEDEQRVILRARVLAPVPFVALVTHLSVKPAERLAQAEVLGGAVAVEAGPVVLLGDLNDVPGSPTLAAAEAGLVDCFDAAGEGEPVTFSVRAPQVRIDYIACGGGLAPAGPARVVRGATASDHFPLEAVVGPG